jgi:hypothetical protein
LVLLELVVSSVGALNEREPLTEAKWAECEGVVVLPEFPSGFSESPILATMIAYFRSTQADINELQPFVGRIILPIPQRLRRETAGG